MDFGLRKTLKDQVLYLTKLAQADHYQKDLERLRPDKVMMKPVSLEELTRSVELLLEEGVEAEPAPGRRKVEATGKVKLLVVEGAVPGPEQRLITVKKSTKRPGAIVAAKGMIQVVEEEEEKTAKKPAAKKK